MWLERLCLEIDTVLLNWESEGVQSVQGRTRLVESEHERTTTGYNRASIPELSNPRTIERADRQLGSYRDGI